MPTNDQPENIADPPTKLDPDSDRAQSQPGEINRTAGSGASREIKADDIREPAEKLLGSEDDQSDFGGPVDLDVPDIPTGT